MDGEGRPSLPSRAKNERRFASRVRRALFRYVIPREPFIHSLNAPFCLKVQRDIWRIRLCYTVPSPRLPPVYNDPPCIPPTLEEQIERERERERSSSTYPAMGRLSNSVDETVDAVRDYSGGDGRRRPRFLCLHGFRTSGDIMRTQVMGKWSAEVTSRLELVFPDAPFPAEGPSDVEGIFPSPYYEWFQFSKDFLEYRNLEECFKIIEEMIIKHGPIDGLMGFSQGAILSAALIGLQAKGLALTRVPKMKFLIVIGGAKFRSSLPAKAYESKIECSSLHFIGEEDFLKKHGEELIESFVNPCVIRHPKGHTVPRFDEKSLETMHKFLKLMEDDSNKI